MSVTRVRVEARRLGPNASKEERDRNFKVLKTIFNRAVDSAGILTRYKECQSYESKGEKRRRKRRFSEYQASVRKLELKTRLRDHFGG